MKRIGLAVLFLMSLLLAACAKKNIENKEAIRQAVIDYLNSAPVKAKTGLDMSTMDVNVTAMTFERDTARATVDFRVKGGDAGMQFNYTLDRKGDAWVVQGRQDSGQGHGVVMPGNDKAPGELPAGHPSIPDSIPASPKQ